MIKVTIRIIKITNIIKIIKIAKIIKITKIIKIIKMFFRRLRDILLIVMSATQKKNKSAQFL